MKIAMLGAVVWVGLCVAPLDPNLGIATIEKLFLLGPLVVVPLGMELAGMRWPWTRWASGLAVVVSFLMPAGWVAGVITVPWLMTCAIVALTGVTRLMLGPREFCVGAAAMGLAIGGLGLLQSRWGMKPMGFYEPWVLLVAVHFHYAAFVTPLVAGEVVERMRLGKWPLALGAASGSPVLASGYVLHVPTLRLLGAMLLVVTLVVMAAWTLWNLKRIRPRAAQVLLGVSAISVVTAMMYAAVYALADFFGEVWIAVPQMARTHGMLQAVGFSVCGLLGWVVAVRKTTQGIGSLTRRWNV